MVCLSRDSVDVPVPFKVLAVGHSEVFAGLNGFKLVVVEDGFGC